MPELSTSSPKREESRSRGPVATQDSRNPEVSRAVAPNRGRVSLAILTDDQRAVPMDLDNGALYHRMNHAGAVRPPVTRPAGGGSEREALAENLRGGAAVPRAAVSPSQPGHLKLPGVTPEGSLDARERDLVERQRNLANVDPRNASQDEARQLGSAYVLNRVLDAKLRGGVGEASQTLGELSDRFVNLQQREGRFPSLERLEAMQLAPEGASRVLPKAVQQAYIEGIQKTLSTAPEPGIINARQVVTADRMSSALERVRVYGGAEAVLGKAEVAPLEAKGATRRERLGQQLHAALEGAPLADKVQASGQILQAMEGARGRLLQASQLRGHTAQAAIADQAAEMRHGVQVPKGGLSLESQKRILDQIHEERRPVAQKAVQEDFRKLEGYLEHRQQALGHAGAGRSAEAHASLDVAVSHWEALRGQVRPETMAALRDQGFGPGQVLEEVKGVHPNVQQEAWGQARLERITAQIPAGAEHRQTFLYRQPGRQMDEFMPLAAYRQGGAQFLAFEHKGRVVVEPMESLTQDPRRPGHALAIGLSDVMDKGGFEMSRRGFSPQRQTVSSASAFRGIRTDN